MDFVILVPALVGIFTVLLLASCITDVMRSSVQEVTLQHSTLAFSPNSLRRREIVVLFLLAVLKHGLKLVGYIDELEVKDDGYILPECSVTAAMTITESDITAFQQVLPHENSARDNSFDGTAHDFFLPCITSVMIPFLLVKLKAAISPLGALNTRNRFEYQDLSTCRNPVGRSILTASIGGDKLGRRTRKGREVDVYVEARMDSQKDPYFRQIFTVLEFLPSHAMPLYDDSQQIKHDDHSSIDRTSATSTHDIVVSKDAPWLWARFCKDYNPIHISTFVARLFGFAGRLVHGNHLAAMAIGHSGSLMGVSGARPPGKKNQQNNSKSQKNHDQCGRFIEVKFIKPVLLGSTIEALSLGDNMTLMKGDQTVMTIRSGTL